MEKSSFIEPVMDDLYLDDAQWTNIQRPIVESFGSLQSAVFKTDSRLDGIDRKVEVLAGSSDTRMRRLEDNLAKLSSQFEQVFSAVESQNTAIDNLNYKMSSLSKRVDEVNLTLNESKLASTDDLYQHIQAQIQRLKQDSEKLNLQLDENLNATGDLERKLDMKANQRELDDVVPFKIDQAARKLQNQINDIKKDMTDCASKDDIAGKATLYELREVTMELSEKVSRQDFNDGVNEQVRPLVNAVASLEKAIMFIEEGHKSVKNDVEILRPICASAAASADSARMAANSINHLDQNAVLTIIDQVLKERQLDVTSAGLTVSLGEYREVLLRDVGTYFENTKEEIRVAMDRRNDILRNQMDKRLIDMGDEVKEAKETNSRIKNGVKELASNVAKALSKKADRQEFKRFVDEQHATTTAAAVNAANSVLMSGTSAVGTDGLPVRDPFSTSRSSASNIGNSLDVGDMAIIKQDMDNIQRTNHQIRADMLHMQKLVSSLSENVDQKVSMDDINSGAVIIPVKSENDKNWRIALGEFETAIRRDVDTKADREEMYSAVRSEISRLETMNLDLIKEKGMDSGDNTEKIEAIEKLLKNEIGTLSSKLEKVSNISKSVSSDVNNGGRWLWTSGNREADGWIPWDTEAHNGSPHSLVWSEGSHSVHARVPGLYKLQVAVFTTMPVALQVCLNWEPLLSIHPSRDLSVVSDVSSDHDSVSSRTIVQGQGNVVRSKHPAGEVSCLMINEIVSLPAESVLAVRYHAIAAAQAMFVLKKI
jgi:hypothetical protein